MAATARRDFDSGEEDIAAIAKQISDHAEAIYQNWKARGLAPTEILSCKPGTGLRLTDNLNDKDSEIDREFEFNHPPDIVPQKPEAPKRPVGLGVRKGAALEVAREEERLMKALRTGAVLAERPSSRPPDVVPSLSYVDYAKNRYQDRLENPPTRRSERERRASVGAQVMETKTKFEARVRRASSAGATPSPGIVEQTAPVRPFLTRGSVAERVMMFEKCPSEVMMDNKRKAPAVAAWRAQHDANKVQNHAAAKIPLPSTVNVSIPRENGIGPTNTEQPAKTTSSTTKSATANSLKSATKSSGGILKPASAPAHTTLRRGVRARPGDGVPKFHFPKGRPPPSHAVEKALHNVQSAISTFPNSQVPRESFHHVVRGSGCPLYWKMPLFLATQQSLHSPVDGRTFIEFWKKMTSECHDQASRLVYVLTRGASNTLAPEDFIPMVQDVVDTHPGLSFLKEANEFHSRYVHTVIARIFYCVNRSWTGRITIPELRKSNLLQVIQLLEEEEDINQVTAYFSYEHFYVIYCKFWELDRDHDLFIDKNDLARHNDHALSSRMIERVLSGCVTRGNQNRVTADGEPRMSYTEFVWFLLAEEDKMHPTAIEYWFRCMDLDGDGYLSMYELEYFYEEQTHRMEAIGIETLPFLDCLCQMLDMVHPGEDGKVTLSDLKKCKMTPVFFDTFFNLEKYLDHEQRDPFASQRDGESDMSEWDRFAAEEYELLVAEEGGSDAQDQMIDDVSGFDRIHWQSIPSMQVLSMDPQTIDRTYSSYDETDEDCLSPNLDEITSAEIIEDSSIEDSSLNDGMHCFSQRSKTDDPATYSTRAQINHQNGPGYVNLNSIYSLSANERWQPTATSPIKNGSDKTLKLAPNEKPMTPEKPVSLTMVNGRTDNRYASFGGNNSFLYSHVSTNQNGRARDPPSYTTATSGHLFNRMSSDKVTSPILSPCHSGRINSPFSPNKISENYERAVAERLSPQRETAKIHPGIFCATVGKQIKSPTKYKDDEDDDYARDSDECSI